MRCRTSAGSLLIWPFATNFSEILFKIQQFCSQVNEFIIDGLVQDCRNSIANALELLQSCTKPSKCGPFSLQWHHNERDGVSNHQPHDCLLNRSFRRRSKKTTKLCVTGLCTGNSPVTGEFPAQTASNAENVSIWWRHHVVRASVWCMWLTFDSCNWNNLWTVRNWWKSNSPP